MQQPGFIAAIDLGTSKIAGVAGRKNDNNTVSVLAYATTPSENSVRRGAVHNIDEVGARVRKVVTMLENKLGETIDKVYISLTGQSLHSFDFWETKQLAGNTVTEDTLVQLKEMAGKFAHPDGKRCFAIADMEYFLDDKAEQNPVGVPCSLIEAEYKIIVGRSSLSTNIEKSVKEKAKLKIAGTPIGIQASAAIALTPEEKMLGCAFIDFGAGTTTLSVYKGGILRRMVVIPFGGKTITEDIRALNYTEEQAESSKIKLGSATDKQQHKDKSKGFGGIVSPFAQKTSPLSGSTVELNNAIKMRLEEIVVNIEEQIKQSGYEGELGAGLIITGGASQLRNLDTYLTEKLKLPVRKASANKAYISNMSELAADPSLTQLLGLLLLGKNDCSQVQEKAPVVEQEEKEEVEVEVPKTATNIKSTTTKKDSNAPVKRRFGRGIGSLLDGLFKDEEDEEDN